MRGSLRAYKVTSQTSAAGNGGAIRFTAKTAKTTGKTV